MKCRCGATLVRVYAQPNAFWMHLDITQNADYAKRTRKHVHSNFGYDYNAIYGGSHGCSKPEPEELRTEGERINQNKKGEG